MHIFVLASSFPANKNKLYISSRGTSRVIQSGEVFLDSPYEYPHDLGIEAGRCRVLLEAQDASFTPGYYEKVDQLPRAYETKNVPQVVTIGTIADVASSLDLKYFVISSPTEKVGFWIDVDNNGGVLPPALVALSDRQVEVTTIVAGDSASAVATKLAVAIAADAAFSAVSAAAVVTVTNEVAGPLKAAPSAGNSGFALAQVVQSVSVLACKRVADFVHNRYS